MKLKYDTLLSRLGFKFKWNPYATGETATFRLARAGKADKRGKIEGEVCDARGVRAVLISGNTSAEATSDNQHIQPTRLIPRGFHRVVSPRGFTS